MTKKPAPIVYLHKPTGRRFAAYRSNGDEQVLEPILGTPLRATPDELSNAEVWQRIP